MKKQSNEETQRHQGAGPEAEQFTYYPLPDLLLPGHTLVLNMHLGLLSHLAQEADDAGQPRLLAQEQFSANELSVLKPLLASYPDYCPYELLYASFNYGAGTTEQGVERARLRLHEAQFAGTWDYEMRPIRNILSRTRFKLRAFRLDVRSILETGYLLKPLNGHAESNEHMTRDQE